MLAGIRTRYILRSVDLWVRNCVNPASSFPLATGAFSRNSLPINLHISVEQSFHLLDPCLCNSAFVLFELALGKQAAEVRPMSYFVFGTGEGCQVFLHSISVFLCGAIQ